MRAIKNHIAFSLFIIALIGSGCVSTESVQRGTYEDINRLVEGRDVVVVLLDSTRYHAEDIAIFNDSTYWISEAENGPQQHVVSTSEIKQIIEFRRGKGVASGMVAGALGGAGLGFVVGAAVGSSAGGGWGLAAGLLLGARGALIGIPVGAIVAAVSESQRTYEIDRLEMLQPDNIGCNVISKNDSFGIDSCRLYSP